MRLSRHFDDQRHAAGQLVVVALAPQIILPQMITVVTPETDHRVFAQPEFVEVRQQTPDLSIDETAAGVVGTTHFVGQFFIRDRLTALAGNTVIDAHFR